ncbi:Ig-like domain-containing protein [Pseudomonas sp. SWRI81]|uniref:Ig-like domain-containing protein n=1 Tax=Pseudomonas sp. SWRI81 TaxID=2745505 RepID=UPI001644C825|nr:Ig-like domain-containing protein [Pseudomonas sp. SWRI81]MBC3270166.1 Ig-like domain-containing protein [Pseudomonas sp. SWRI81]
MTTYNQKEILQGGATGVAALQVDTSLLTLNGIMVRSNYCRNFTGVDAIGNSAVRQPSGGIPPYRYTSSNTRIAAVDAQGKVTGMGNGSATIRITDQSNAQVSYSVAISNVYDLLVGHAGMPNTYSKYMQHLALYDYASMTPQIRAVLDRCYFQPWIEYFPSSTTAWTGIANDDQAEVYSGEGTFDWVDQSVHNSGLVFSLHGFGVAQETGYWEVAEPFSDK